MKFRVQVVIICVALLNNMQCGLLKQCRLDVALLNLQGPHYGRDELCVARGDRVTVVVRCISGSRYASQASLNPCLQQQQSVLSLQYDTVNVDNDVSLLIWLNMDHDVIDSAHLTFRPTNDLFTSQHVLGDLRETRFSFAIARRCESNGFQRDLTWTATPTVTWQNGHTAQPGTKKTSPAAQGSVTRTFTERSKRKTDSTEPREAASVFSKDSVGRATSQADTVKVAFRTESPSLKGPREDMAVLDSEYLHGLTRSHEKEIHDTAIDMMFSEDTGYRNFGRVTVKRDVHHTRRSAGADKLNARTDDKEARSAGNETLMPVRSVGLAAENMAEEEGLNLNKSSTSPAPLTSTIIPDKPTVATVTKHQPGRTSHSVDRNNGTSGSDDNTVVEVNSAAAAAGGGDITQTNSPATADSVVSKVSGTTKASGLISTNNSVSNVGKTYPPSSESLILTDSFSHSEEDTTLTTPHTEDVLKNPDSGTSPIPSSETTIPDTAGEVDTLNTTDKASNEASGSNHNMTPSSDTKSTSSVTLAASPESQNSTSAVTVPVNTTAGTTINRATDGSNVSKTTDGIQTQPTQEAETFGEINTTPSIITIPASRSISETSTSHSTIKTVAKTSVTQSSTTASALVNSTVATSITTTSKATPSFTAVTSLNNTTSTEVTPFINTTSAEVTSFNNPTSTEVTSSSNTASTETPSLVNSTTKNGSTGSTSGLSLPQDNSGNEETTEPFWPVVAGLVIGIPSVIVVVIAVTVIYKRRHIDPRTALHLSGLHRTSIDI